MPQPGREDKPDAFWHELDKYMLQAGMNPTLAGYLLVHLKVHVKSFEADLRAHFAERGGEVTADEVFSLVRDHIYGWPPI